MKKFRLDYIFDGIALALAGIQIEEIFKWVQLSVGLFATLLSVAFTLWQWWKRAKKDGKITEEEINEGIDILNNGIDELKDKSKKGEEK